MEVIFLREEACVMKNATGAEKPEANRFTPDARRRIEQLRAVADEFPDEAKMRRLTPMEVRLARHTPIEALERAAVFLEAAPGFAGNIDIEELREVIYFELAYGNVRDEARAVAHRIDHAILRRKLQAVKTVRALYRMAKGYMTMDAGDDVRIHVQALKQTLVRPRRRKKSETAE